MKKRILNIGVIFLSSYVFTSELSDREIALQKMMQKIRNERLLQEESLEERTLHRQNAFYYKSNDDVRKRLRGDDIPKAPKMKPLARYEVFIPALQLPAVVNCATQQVVDDIDIMKKLGEGV